MSVPALSMALMAAAMVFAFGAPIVLLFYYKKRGAQVLPFFIGCAVFVVFALILEALVHNIVLKGLPVGEKIMGNTLLYALYGGLMAGLFEETGRFLAFKT
ncbi:MAG: YhfC family intramembrane metalloprotease, partial [Clostridia bacterium]|nr:YhfC family intramembrane metalloprotease [Clostridia bacterium]